jgi:hypothetical protein
MRQAGDRDPFGGLVIAGVESVRGAAAGDFFFGGRAPFTTASSGRAPSASFVVACGCVLGAFGKARARVELVSRSWACNADAPPKRRNPAITRAAVRIRVIR